MATLSIALGDFKENLRDICRPNRFQVNLSGNIPDSLFDPTDFFFVKACSIPGKTLGEIELGWGGYKYKIAGDPTFNDVTVTFLNEISRNGNSTHDKFLEWMNLISTDTSNTRMIHSEYKCNVNIFQLDFNGDVVGTYVLEHAHPKDISEIALSMDSNDTVEEFNVVFSYSYFTWGAGDQSGSAGGSSAPVGVNDSPFGGFA